MPSDKSSGIFLPQWMKSKIGDRIDSDYTPAPSRYEDGSFYYIRYPAAPESDNLPKTLADVTQPTTMKRSSTSPESEFKAAAEDSSSSSFYNVLTGKLFGNYLTPDKGKEEIYKHRERRNSKSLPASPLSSPRVYRRNPYFTDPFLKPDDKLDGTGRSFLYFTISSQRTSLENLLGVVDANAASVNEAPPASKNGRPELVPKPSELREMNCWSPVSM